MRSARASDGEGVAAGRRTCGRVGEKIFCEKFPICLAKPNITKTDAIAICTQLCVLKIQKLLSAHT